MIYFPINEQKSICIDYSLHFREFPCRHNQRHHPCGKIFGPCIAVLIAAASLAANPASMVPENQLQLDFRIFGLVAKWKVTPFSGYLVVVICRATKKGLP